MPKSCPPGDEIRYSIPFPQCWDGKNLDSPNHKSHMAYPVFNDGPSWIPSRQYKCPATHPVVLPQITVIPAYDVPANGDTSSWRLSSDMYDPTQPAGYSRHADWFNGWDQEIAQIWGKKCMQERRNCGTYMIGDGREAVEFQGN